MLHFEVRSVGYRSIVFIFAATPTPALTPNPSPKLGRGEQEASGIPKVLWKHLYVIVPLLPIAYSLFTQFIVLTSMRIAITNDE